MRVLLVFGTRPEAIKMAPLVKEFQKYQDIFETLVCLTGQHREMLDQVMKLFEIKADFDLNIMKQGQDLFDITSRILLGLRGVLEQSKPDLVLVHGDTSTSTAAALAAFYKQIPVGHIEAGLRTKKIYSPWPEEMNRQITGRIANYHFAPTALSKKNLLKEDVNEDKIVITGNTVIDALFWVIDKIKSNENLKSDIVATLTKSGLPIEITNDYHSKLVLITGHRRENFGDGFTNICNAIKVLTEKYPNVNFVYPMHLNPNVRKPIQDIFGSFDAQKSGVKTKNLYFIEPLDYLPFVYLMSNSTLVLTDSGGIQEEAPGLGIPVLVMRDTTERPEALEAGTVKLVGTNKELIVSEVSKLLNNKEFYESMAKANNPYGDGEASKRIVEFIKDRSL